MTSKDGINWTPHKYKGDRFNRIIWAKDKFVAVEHADSANKSIWTSTNGIDWSPVDYVFRTYSWLDDLAWDGKRFVATGGPNGVGVIFTSEDGLNWTERTSGLKTSIKSIAYGNGVFVGLGYKGNEAVVSKDGITWKKYKTSKKDLTIWDIDYGGGLFYGVGDQSLIYSKDGVNWTEINSTIYWYKATWVKDRFYLAGNERMKDGTYHRVMMSTTKDNKLTPVKLSNDDATLFYILYNNEQLITSTSRGLLKSKDGLGWTYIKRFPLHFFDAMNDAAASPDKMVMVGGYRASYDVPKGSYAASIRLDSNGVWKSNEMIDSFPLNSVAWTGSEFLSVGHKGIIMASKDGITWSNLPSPTKNSLNVIRKFGDKIYIGGDNGTLYSSKDGRKWTKCAATFAMSPELIDNVSALSSNGKVIVAAGKYGVIETSSDGVKWSKSNIDSVSRIYDITWESNRFWLSDSSDNTYYSVDGKKWDRLIRLSPDYYSNGIMKIVAANDLFVGISEPGTFYLSQGSRISGYLEWEPQKNAVGTWNATILFKNKIYSFKGQEGMLIGDLSKPSFEKSDEDMPNIPFDQLKSK